MSSLPNTDQLTSFHSIKSNQSFQLMFAKSSRKCQGIGWRGGKKTPHNFQTLSFLKNFFRGRGEREKERETTKKPNERKQVEGDNNVI